MLGRAHSSFRAPSPRSLSAMTDTCHELFVRSLPTRGTGLRSGGFVLLSFPFLFKQLCRRRQDKAGRAHCRKHRAAANPLGFFCTSPWPVSSFLSRLRAPSGAFAALHCEAGSSFFVEGFGKRQGSFLTSLAAPSSTSRLDAGVLSARNKPRSVELSRRLRFCFKIHQR